MKMLLAMLIAALPVTDQIPDQLPDGVVLTADLNVRPSPVVEMEPRSYDLSRDVDDYLAVPEPPAPASSSDVPEPWHSLAICESGMNGEPRWDYNGGSGFDGGLQFLPATWTAYGGGEFASHAYDATPSQQVAIAERVLAEQGWGAWPSCSSKLGLR